MVDIRRPSIELISRIYDASLESHLWVEIFSEIRSALDADLSVVAIQNYNSGQIETLSCIISGQFIKQQKQEWKGGDIPTAGDSYSRCFISALGVDFIPSQLFYGLEIYSDFNADRIVYRNLLDIGVELGFDKGIIGFHRAKTRPNFNENERNWLHTLLPHLQKSLQISRRLYHMQRQSSISTQIIDTIPFGIAAVDADCFPVLLNRSAEELLRIGDGLTGGASLQPISTQSREETDKLRQLVGAASKSTRPGGALKVSRPSARPPHAVLVAPVLGRQYLPLQTGKAAAVLFIHDADRSPVPRTKVLADLYSLSAAECVLCELLVIGARLEDIAAERSVRISTLRSQLSSILAKTHTDRQSALVRLLTLLSVAGGGHIK